jgi:hypothetical protein
MSDESKKKPASVRVAGELLFARRDRFSNRSELFSIACSHPEGRARMASALIEKWGMVAAAHDGEDSAGRTRLRLMTPPEVVNRACDTAEYAYAVFEKRGWLHDVPDEILLEGDPEE